MVGGGIACLLLTAAGCDGEDLAPDSDEASVQGELDELRAHAPKPSVGGQAIPAKGAFSCDFAIDFTQVTAPLGATIERDRVLSQRFVDEYTWPANPGMLQKHIPILQTSPTSAFAGGRYLFQGRLQAAIYELWITQLYAYPGNTQFLDRPEFGDPECRDWSVLSAWRFADLEDHTALRTERFDTGRTTIGGELWLAFELLQETPALLAEAEARGYSEVQLVQNFEDHKVQLVYFVSRVAPPDPELPDVAALGSIAADAPLGDGIADEAGLTRVFDRSSLVFNTWLPYASGDGGEAALWPNSPPLPAPFCGDGVCLPSRGEVSDCPADCAPTCGDAICQAGEDTTLCPSDCALPFVD